MSLLNNALREAEERQRRPEVSGAYTGAVQDGRGSRRWLLLLIGLLVIGLTLAAIYWFVSVNGATSAASSAADSPDGKVEREVAAGGMTEEPRLQMAERQADTGPEAQTEKVELAAPETTPSVAQLEPAEPRAEPKTKPEPVPEPEPESEPETTAAAPAEKAEPKLGPGMETEAAEPVPTPESERTLVVKTVPQSPEAIDRKTSRELETLIGAGRVVEAERQLAALVQTQNAPLSRFVVARELLVGGDATRALDWLPAEAAARDARLRMLQARALHSDGRLSDAIAALETNVPEVGELPEYRVTLATLLQQEGRAQAAAGHWAELLAWDDSRAPWWVGLAIALEEQGEVRGAARAYEQAAALPGLPPSLADYVQRRLQSLRAG